MNFTNEEIKNILQSPKAKTIMTIEEYLTAVLSHEYGTFYRGMDNIAYKLVPALGRFGDESNQAIFLRSEDTALETLTKQYMQYINGKIDCNSLDILVLAQHHGLPTRLLDWSLNPLTALYFATKTYHNGKDAIVYVHHPKWYPPYIPLDIINQGFNDVGEYLGIEIDENTSEVDIKEASCNYLIYKANHVTTRIRAQDGCFTFHLDPFLPIPLDDIDTILIIPQDECFNIYEKLSRIGVNEATLFPDIDGLCSWLKRGHFTNEELQIKKNMKE